MSRSVIILSCTVFKWHAKSTAKFAIVMKIRTLHFVTVTINTTAFKPRRKLSKLRISSGFRFNLLLHTTLRYFQMYWFHANDLKPKTLKALQKIWLQWIYVGWDNFSRLIPVRRDTGGAPLIGAFHSPMQTNPCVKTCGETHKTRLCATFNKPVQYSTQTFTPLFQTYGQATLSIHLF